MLISGACFLSHRGADGNQLSQGTFVISVVTAVVAIRRCSGPLISVSLASAALVVSCTRNVRVLLVVGYFRRRFRRRLHQHFIAVGIIAISNFGSINSVLCRRLIRGSAEASAVIS